MDNVDIKVTVKFIKQTTIGWGVFWMLTLLYVIGFAETFLSKTLMLAILAISFFSLIRSYQFARKIGKNKLNNSKTTG